jgi:NAD(P)-dependent dehydrogenase (short-subunit alcohol dehydrogenase family)
MLSVRGKLRGKVAVITGASSGVGRAIARAFAREGASVGLIARSEEGLEGAASEARVHGVSALVLPLDVSDAHAVDLAAERVASEWGKIDVWVNDAMVSVFARVSDITPSEYRRVMEVNYLGYVHGTLAALKYMRERDAGVIIQIGSALAYRSIPLQSAYCASKAAIRGFTDSLRSELLHESSKIRLTMLQLPAVNTPQFEVVRNRLHGHPQPVPPIYQPELIADATVHAALRPRREAWLGWNTCKAIVGQRLLPGYLDRYVAEHAWDSQVTERLPEGHPPSHAMDNVFAPLAGDRGAHGPFDGRARSWDWQIWLSSNRAWAGIGAVTIGLLALSLARWGRR